MEITDSAILVLKSFLNLFRISVIILRGGVSSGIVQMFCHIVDDVGCYGRVILLPFILFVVSCGTFLNYDEDIDILVEFCFMLI